MAKIVSAVASTHNPRICWNRDQADQAELERLYNTFKEARELLAASRPDIIVVVANDHMDGLYFDNMPCFSVLTSPIAEGPYWYETEIMNLPSYSAKVELDAAKSILRNGREEGLYFTQLSEFKIDHAFTLPLAFIRPEQDIPIVPIVTNTFGYPIPSTKHWYNLGRFLQAEVASWPAHLRVCVVASFNLTVEVGGPKAGKYDMEFTRWLVEQMSNGAAETLLNTLTVPKLISHGNSTAEFLNYISLLGIVQDRKPSFIQSKPVKGVGMCPVAFWNLE